MQAGYIGEKACDTVLIRISTNGYLIYEYISVHLSDVANWVTT